MIRIAATIMFAATLASCDVVNTMVESSAHARAVESDLAAATGVKPQVGFNWTNGRLMVVVVTYPNLNETKPLHDLAEAARAAVSKEFKQVPEKILLTFTLNK